MLERAMNAQIKHINTLMNMDGVVGVAIGEKTKDGHPTGQEAVTILVQRKLPISALSSSVTIPKQLDDVATDVIEIGYPRAYNSDQRSKHIPPIPAGISAGHHKITAGTYGALVRDVKSGDALLLSNNHVFANSNDANLQDNILQPGSYDGGSMSDSIAWLERFVPIKYLGEYEEPKYQYSLADGLKDFGNAMLMIVRSNKRLAVSIIEKSPPVQPTNIVDAALARPFHPEKFENNILNIGTIKGSMAPSLKQSVRKMGRTTGYTEGTIQLLNATVDVSYGANRVARFNSQIIIGQTGDKPFSQGGDSGSLIVDGSENKAVGLLFAGSETTTIASPISLVMRELGIVI